MTTRFRDVAMAPLAVAALGVLCAPAYSLASPPSTPPPARTGALHAAPAANGPDRFRAAWLSARGLDAWQSPAIRPDAVSPAGAGGGGNPDDTQWQTGFGLPAPDNQISALLVQDGLLIAGGWFRQIGDLAAPAVAAWNGASWSAIGQFPAEIVLDLAPHPQGLIALGEFADLWQWDGTTWQPLGYIPASYSLDLAALDQQIAVSAWVQEATGWHSRVYLRSGTGWQQLGGTFDDAVEALAWYGGDLYAAGRFQHIDGVAARLVVRWDGTAWQPVADGLTPSTYEDVSALAVFAGELVAGGSFGSDADPATQPRGFARWNGTRWAPLGTDVPYIQVTRLRALGSSLYAVGRTNDHGITRWDGTAWHVDEDSLQAFVYDVAEYQGELYAGGALVRDGSSAAPPLVRRRNGRWQSPLAPSNVTKGLLGWSGPAVHALVATAAGITAAGRFEFAGDADGWTHCPGFARWNGTRWSSAGDAAWSNIEPFSMTLHAGSLYASGSFSSAFEYGSVARLDGDTWHLIGEPFLNVYRVASALGSLYAAGAGSGDTGPIPFAWWDGSAWRQPGGAWHGNYLSAITTLGDEVIVGGWFDQIGGVPCHNVAAWSPARGWRSLGEGLSKTVADLTARNGILYAAGESGIFLWKNGAWQSLGNRGYTWSLGWFHGRLVASGSGLPGYLGILGADDTLRSMGSGLNGPALSFAEHGSSLFVGGFFSQAGGHAAYGFAEWREDEPATPTAPGSVSVGPNPSAVAAHLRYELAASTRVRVEIHDLTGRLVDTPFDGVQGPGTQEVTWQPVPGHVSAGVYFAKVVIGSTSRVVRVVRVD